MKKIAMIKNGVVENIANWDGDQAWSSSVSQAGFSLVELSSDHIVSIGYLYSGGEFTAPAPVQE